MAQRLARKICQNCKSPYTVQARELRRFGFKSDDPKQEVTLWRGSGCETCRETGYKGRIGIYELMRMNDEIAELVVRRAFPSPTCARLQRRMVCTSFAKTVC
jgi:type IV pilus assembly protein PilB